MSKKSSSDNVGDSNETTEATLTALTMQINEFVSGGTLDSRCAAKLVKRLKKEADAVAESGKATKTGQKELKKAFGAVDAALCDHDAKLLVTANAALRTTDEVASPRESP
ncbi:hypothetical protein [Paraburkholderia domus]|uniref:hypothetical protein n=1 Tax=Paraburkholderia domus TaxID=2793075 RepID=UPI001913CD3B|nr:hypothetical protein [Paraburkholderia domus]MBK5066397.1 hypothetical protein [Burkholderia sp. R-70199]CAE6970128.1 hypothetical protein R70199_08152 [Paraburkholderia domus]